MLTLPKMTDYAATCASFRLDVPAHFNFGFDVIAERARSADKAAVVAVDSSGQQVRSLRYSDLDRASNRVADRCRVHDRLLIDGILGSGLC